MNNSISLSSWSYGYPQVDFDLFKLNTLLKFCSFVSFWHNNLICREDTYLWCKPMDKFSQLYACNSNLFKELFCSVSREAQILRGILYISNPLTIIGTLWFQYCTISDLTPISCCCRQILPFPILHAMVMVFRNDPKENCIALQWNQIFIIRVAENSIGPRHAFFPML